MALPPLKQRITADTSELEGGLNKGGVAIAKFAKAGAAAVAALGAAMIALTRRSLENIDTLTKQARSLGLTTKAFQQMTLVAEEAGVATGQLNSMLGLMQRNIVELGRGTRAQVDAFERLGLSISDLEGMSPDAQFERIAMRLNEVEDSTEKTATAMDIFGRSGRGAINMLEEYGQKSANAAAFQERFGIAVAQDVAENVEAANDAVGRLGQVFVGLGNRIAGTVAPSIERAANGLIDMADNVFGVETSVEALNRKFEELSGFINSGDLEKLAEDLERAADVEGEIDQLRASLDDVGNTANDLVPQLQQYGNALANSGSGEEAARVQTLTQRMSDLVNSFNPATDSAEEFRGKLSEVQSELQSIVEAGETVDGVTFSAVLGQVIQLGQELSNSASQAARLANNITSMDMTTGTPLSGDGSLLPPGPRDPLSGGPRPPEDPRSIDSDLPQARNDGGGGGAGGGLAEMMRADMERRLELLREGLLSERELLLEDFETKNELLREGLEQEIITEQEYREQKERLEAQHQDRLEQLAQREVSMRRKTQNSIIGLLGQLGKKNEAFAKAAVVLNAAQRVSEIQGHTAAAVMQAYAQFGPIAGAPLAAKMKAMGAIQTAVAAGSAALQLGGSGGSGGGSSSRAGSAGSAGSSAQSVINTQRVDLNIIGGTDRDRMVASTIIDTLNDAQRDGFRLDPRLIGVQ